MRTAVTPSPRAYPSADASNDLDDPVGDKTPSLENETVCSGLIIVFAPATMSTSTCYADVVRHHPPMTSAWSTSPSLIEQSARCIAVADAEQAV